MLKKVKALLARTETTSTPTQEGTPTTVEVHPEPLMSEEGPDPLDTSFVETGPLLVTLNPFEGEEELVICPTTGSCPGAAVVVSETIRVESNVETPLGSTGKKAPKQTAARKVLKQSMGRKAPRK